MEKLNGIFAALAMVFFCTGLLTTSHLLSQAISGYIFYIQVVCAFSCFCCGIVSFRISRSIISQRHTFKTALRHYLLNTIFAILSVYGVKSREKYTKMCRKTQENILLKILKTNASTVYGKDNHFENVKSREDFSRLHPLIKYEYIDPYIERVANGEKNVFTVETPDMFALSSGTTGKSKKIPQTPSQTKATMFASLGANTLSTKGLQKFMRLISRSKYRESPAGIPMSPLTGNLKYLKAMMFLYTDPDPVTDIVTEPETTYLHLLFALSDRHTGVLYGIFASLLYSALYRLESEWKTLANDIRLGRINPDLQIDHDIRRRLNSELNPNPERADELTKEFEKGFVGIVKRIWPHINLIICIDTGFNLLYGKLLRSKTCKGVPFYAGMYGSSESALGSSITFEQHEKREYVLFPQLLFYEFIPVANSDDEQPKTLFAEQVSVGAEYEIAVTTYSGLCRFRIGDVVRVTGFHNETPVIEFRYRIAEFLNVRAEKTSQATFMDALIKAADSWPGVSVLDYCCAESGMAEECTGTSKSIVPCYYVFLELLGDEKSKQLSYTQRNMIDEALCDDSDEYNSYRKKGAVGSMKVHILKEGAFRELKRHTIETSNASHEQYKVPRKLWSIEDAQFILDRVVS